MAGAAPADAGARLAELSPLQRRLLSERLRQRATQPGGARAEKPPLLPAERDRPLPLSYAQQRLWFLERFEPGGFAYNQPAAFRLQGRLAVAALVRSLREIVARHEALRTVFREVEGGPVQVVLAAGPAAVQLVDLRGLAATVQAAEVQRTAALAARRRFDLERGPLLRLELFALSGAEHVLILTLHHIVSDGWSLGVFARELGALYAAFARGLPSPLPPLALQYADFTVWQRQWLAGEVLARQLAYWRQQLAGLPPLHQLPADRPRPAARSHRGAVSALRLPPALAARLRQLAEQEGGTLFMVLLTGFQTLLFRWSGSGDQVVGSPIANRNLSATEGMIGFFVNTLVLRTELAAGLPFREALGRVREVALGAYAHQDLPFERLVEELQPERLLGTTPLFQLMMALQNAPLPPLALPGLTLTQLDVDTGAAKFDLALSLWEAEGALAGVIEYSADLFDADRIGRLAGHLQNLLESAAADPGRELLDLPLLGRAERFQLLAEWNDGGASGAAVAVHEPVEERARLAPDTIAAGMGGAWLSYGELNVRANRLAHLLRAPAGGGAGTDDRVGIFLPRSLALPVAVLAALKAGAGYVPLDPAYPRRRLAHMIEDARLRVLLTTDRLAAILPARGSRVLCLDLEGDAIAAQGAADPERQALPASLAYLMYTSGSTGRPKGIAMPHAVLANLLRWQVPRSRLGAGARTLQFAALSFDASFQEIFATWWAGGTLVLAGEEVRRDPGELRRLLEDEQVERLFVPFVAVQQLAEEIVRRGGEGPPPLREILVAGEALRITAQLVAWLGDAPGCLLENQYGPTEGHVVTAWPLGGNAASWPLLPPIGRPVAGARILVLDERLAPVPAGVPGHLHIGGRPVVRGYHDDPVRTAASFIPDPWSEQPGARLYATGDRARWLAGGVLQFLGRIDHQVKIRGHRVEPGEIEAHLARHSEVEAAAVVVREERSGERRLVAYVVPRQEEVTARDLRAFLSAWLPGPLVPAEFVMLKALPLTASGKVNRRALPEPAVRQGEDAVDAAAPAAVARTPVEELLAGIWAELLAGGDRAAGERGAGAPGRPGSERRIGRDDNFFELGGHSLLATRMTSLLRQRLGVEITVRTVFEHPELAELARVVEEAMAGAARPELPPGQPLGRRPAGAAELSFAQERLWFIAQLEPESPAYNVPAAVRLHGALATGCLARALGEVVRRHEVLRSTFPNASGRARVVIASATAVGAGPLLARVDLAALPGAARREEEAWRLTRRFAWRPFDLARGPLLRACLLRLGEGESVLLLAQHHIVTDGWSIGLLVRELVALYSAFQAEQPSPLPELGLQYADFAHWQRLWFGKEALAGQLAYWRQRLAGLPPDLALPVDRPRQAAPPRRGAGLAFRLERPLTEALRALGLGQGATLFMTLLAGLGVLLGRVSGAADLGIGTPIAGRTRREVEELIGLFVNTLVMRLDLAAAGSFGELLAAVRAASLEAHRHQDLPFERLVEELQPPRSPGLSPLFQVMFVLQNAPAARLELPGLTLTMAAAESQQAKFDLTLSLTETEGALDGFWEYDRGLFDGATVRRLAGAFARLLAAAAAAGGAELPLAELPLLSAAERHQVTVEWNDTAAPGAGEGTIGSAFAAVAAQRPDAVAVAWRETAVSYGEIARWAGAVARRLRRLGIAPGDPVGLCVERSPAMVAGMLGILAAGGAYVPLDPDYPAERLAFMAVDALLTAVVTTPGPAASLPPGLAVARLDVERARSEADGPRPEMADARPAEDAVEAAADRRLGLAYILYTSGSTGRPKGVEVTHGSVLRLARAGDYVRLGAGDRVGQASSLSFDAATFEVWGALLGGGVVVVMEREDLLLPARLAAALARRAVETLFLTAALFHQVVQEEPGAFAPLRDLLVGGEAPEPRAMRRVLGGGAAGAAGRGPRRLLNVYGPTESTTFATWQRVERVEEAAVTVPVGMPLAGTRAHVLDPLLQPVPAGVAGELYLAGGGLARGYWRRPELTAERFVPSPAGTGERLYRTGDLARWRPEGRLEIRGRTDQQVKLRGFRVEPGEVEAALAELPGVRQAAVAMRDDPRAGRALVAYLVATAEGADEWRAALARRLPPYMVPAHFVRVPALPLTANGKLDRAALARLGLPAPAAGTVLGGAPAAASPVEEILGGIIADVLGRARVGPEESFFEAGGHSLLATQVVSRVREALGVELPLRTLFDEPTAAGLARRVAALQPGRRAALAPPLPVRRESERAQASIDGPPRPVDLPLSFAQERLWFLDRLEPGRATYNMPLALAVHGGLTSARLDAVLSEIVRRHEALRTSFAEVAGRPVQRVAPPRRVRLPVAELSALPEPLRTAEVLRLARGDARRPFDLARGPLLRGLLLAATGAPAEDAQVLLLNTHHIVSDGWSFGVLVGEIGALYRAVLAGAPSPLPELPIQYGDFAVWQRGRLGEAEIARQLAHWRQRLAGAPPTIALPTDRPRPPVQSFRGASRGLTLDAAATGRLAACGRRHGTTLYMTLLAGFAACLARWSGVEDLVLGTPIANRNHLATERLIGFFVNSLVLRLDLGGDPPVARLLARVRETALDAYAHQDLPFERLVEELRPDRELSQNPLFQVMFALQNAPRPRVDLPGLMLTPLAAEGPTLKFDLELQWYEEPGVEGGVLAGMLSYAADLFDGATAARLLGHLEALLGGLASEPAPPVSRLPLLSAAERHQLAVEWNDTEAAPGVDVMALFSAAAAADPSASALVALAGVEGGGEVRLSYGELAGWAERVAAHLRGLGVGPGVAVGLAAGRGPALAAGLLGILDAGGAFVPLDPALPAARLAFLLADSGVAVVVGEGRTLAALPPHPGIDVDLASWPLAPSQDAPLPDPPLSASPPPRPRSASDPASAAASPPGPPPASSPSSPVSSPLPGAGRGDLAYLIYTSGTTGRPKAVAVERGSLADILAAARGLLDLGPGDRMLVAAPSSFDIFLFELLSPLTVGATAVLFPLAPALDVERLARALPGLTVVHAVPALARQLLAALGRRQGGAAAAPRALLVGGDTVPAELLADLGRALPSARIWELYGPTEATILASAWNATVATAAGAPRSLLGRPLPGVSLELRDRRGNPVPVGAAGEVWIGGAGVARGYHRRPELTAAAYVPVGSRGGRAVRSGDLARQLADGSLEFLGRVDGQVKVRGFRVETGEVESVLARHAAVAVAVVVARRQEPRAPADARSEAGVQLVAHVVRRHGEGEEAAAALAAEHVVSWRSLYEETYGGAAPDDPALHLVGWNSSYTGLPIPREEMREWVETTVERLLALAPRRVLEVGCGTGLLLFRLAPRCERYHATDFSPTALAFVAEQLRRPGWELPQVSLARAAADADDDRPEPAPGEVDLVILNSVVQYFPSAAYLARAIERAVAVLAPGGRIFVGDVRSLPLAEALYTSVELAATPDGLPVAELRRRVRRRQVDEEELLIAPELWTALARLLPAIARVEIWKKRGRAVNELTRFRHDVVLTVGMGAGADGGEAAAAAPGAAAAAAAVTVAPAAAAAGAAGDAATEGASGAVAAAIGVAGAVPRVRDCRDGRITLTSLAELLAESAPGLVLSGIADRRLAAERAALLLLADPGPEIETVGQLRQAVAQSVAREAGIDPEELCQAAAGLGYDTELQAAGPGTEGGLRFTAVLRRRPAAPGATTHLPAGSGLSPDTTAARGGGGAMADCRLPAAALAGLRRLASDPLRGRVARELVPELRRLVRAELPEYMVPAAFVVLDALPLTVHGKVDRGALPDPDPARPELAGGYAAPRTPLEEGLAGIWAHLLGVDRVGVDDNFFELGGHSLLATQAVSRVRDRFGVELPVRALFEEPTVAGLAQRVAALLPRGQSAAPPLAPSTRTGGLPLSFAQERLWFFDRLEPGSAAYNMPLALELTGRLSIAALAASLSAVVRRHEALRTTFAAVLGRPVQVIAPPRPVAGPLVDLAALPAVRRRPAALALLAAEGLRPFDLAAGPLLRLLLLRLGPERHMALLVLHHIVADGWSMGVLVQELGELYGAAVAGRTPLLPPLPVQYADFAVWQRQWLTGPVLAAQLAHWRRHLAGAPALLELPLDRPRSPLAAQRGRRLVAPLPGAASRGVESLARSHGATPFMVQLAAFAALLGRVSGQQDVVVGSPVANRNRSETERLIGFFVNTLVLRVRLDGGPPFGELVGRVREVSLDGYANQDLPFEKLVSELQPERSLAHTALFQVMFALQNAPLGRVELPGLVLAPAAIERDLALFDLSLDIGAAGEGAGTEGAGGLAGIWEYNRDLFDHATVVRLAGSFAVLLAAVVAAPDLPLAALPLLTAAQRHQLVLALNDTAAPAPRRRPLQRLEELFERSAARLPEAVALAWAGGALSYGCLERRANHLAWELRRRGAGADVTVGICAERSPEAVLAILAVLKAGGAYLPLDPELPRERLALMLDEARPRLVLVQGSCAERLPAGTPILAVAADAGENGERPGGGALPETLAYVIYTSGSTGRPKGVMVPHRGILNASLAYHERLPCEPGDAFLQYTSLSFDAVLWEILQPLAAGARLVLAEPGEHRDPAALLHRVAAEGVTMLQAVPSLAAQLLAEPALGACVSLRRMVCGGETLPPAVAAALAARLPGEVWNVCGPTECSLDAAWWRCAVEGPGGAPHNVPIGRPLPGVRLLVLDGQGAVCPRGVAGELFIGGAALARGYLGRPDLTAERFVPDALGREPGERLYRSGDRVRLRQDGAVEILGRLDQQIKLRGFRIELGEIEAALAAHPGVAQAAVALLADPPRLAAFVVGRGGAAPAAEELRRHLLARLPGHMVPAAWVEAAELPLLPSGKVDRRALAARADDRVADGAPGAPYIAPRTAAEATVAAVWAAVLAVPRVGAQDDFFALGGHSLLAAQVVARLRAELGVEVPLRTLFAAPTVAGLAARVERLRVAGPEGAAPGAAAEAEDAAALLAERLRTDAVLAPEIRPPGAVTVTAENPRHVLLTGATGLLGPHLLREILGRTGATVHCLVRAAGEDEARRRLLAAAEPAGVAAAAIAARVVALAGDLARPALGLTPRQAEALAGTADLIVHNGAAIHFLADYQALRAANVESTREILRLATNGRTKPVAYISTLDVLESDAHAAAGVVTEEEPLGDCPGLPSGYAQSKWVAEKLLAAASERGLPVCVVRSGLIGGDSRSGRGGTNDFSTRLLKALLQLRAFPSAAAALNLMPVDFVAAATVWLALTGSSYGRVFHLTNPRPAPAERLSAALRAFGYRFELVPPERFRSLMTDAITASDGHLLTPFAEMFTADAAAAGAGSAAGGAAGRRGKVRGDCRRTFAALAASGIACPPLDERLLGTYLSYLVDTGFLPPPEAAGEGAGGT